jgi:hypothetical protein
MADADEGLAGYDTIGRSLDRRSRGLLPES